MTKVKCNQEQLTSVLGINFTSEFNTNNSPNRLELTALTDVIAVVAGAFAVVVVVVVVVLASSCSKQYTSPRSCTFWRLRNVRHKT